MKRLAVFAVAMLAILPRGHAELVAVAPGLGRFPTHVAFVVDVSGSMQGRDMTQAVAGVRYLAEQPTDEMNIKVFAFNDETHVWPHGWAELPSQAALVAATAWLNSFTQNKATHVSDALTTALDEPVEDMAVVFLTDGEFNGPGDNDVMDLLRRRQAARAEVGLNPAMVMCVGYGNPDSDVLRPLGEEGGGGYYIDKPGKWH